ncbi:hypothetical protein PMAYCL1PPCAC_29316 [Pristionchus mayeri]|uniref:Uncharacterized protein n=1 Tax=Pristionchus mayeri TaxID=1317129 RepID=A0AAN5D992_9BILA|nr:hypothetical protein PMAYCL1PPCAC_29316 [Pristionchus mayeri]
MAGRRMASLASRFVGGNGVHVVDPSPDWRHVLDDLPSMESNLRSRSLPPTNLPQLKSQYLEWFASFEKMKEGDKSVKKDVREGVSSFLDVLSLPNRLGMIGEETKESMSPEGEEVLKSLGKLRNVKGALSMSDTPVLALKKLRDDLLSIFSQAHTVSPSYFVRAAILEALNEDDSKYLSFSDESPFETNTFLVGHSLPSLLSPLIRTRFSLNHPWPILMQSTGSAYFNAPSRLVEGRQREKYCLVSLCRGEEEAERWRQSTIHHLQLYLTGTLGLNSISSRLLSARQLSLSQSSATVLEREGFGVARVSMYGDYLSRRLNLTLSHHSLVHIGYAEVDLSKLMALLFDPSTPKRVTDAAK